MRLRSILAGLLVVIGLSKGAMAAGGKLDVHPLHGPKHLTLGSNLAELDLPADMVYLDPTDTVKFLKATENIPTGHELAVVAPAHHAQGSGTWFVIVEYNETGYVSDDDANKLDANEILTSIRDATEEANKERQGAALHVDGWAQPPVYEKPTHHVVWAVLGSGGEGKVVNYNTRILGRRGVLEMNLVCDPKDLDTDKRAIGTLLDHTNYVAGQRYEDYQASTDKKAAFGLKGLILGAGAVGVAAKLGLFGKAFKLVIAFLLALKKLVIVLIAGVVGGFKKLFGKKQTQSPTIAAGPPSNPG